MREAYSGSLKQQVFNIHATLKKLWEVAMCKIIAYAYSCVYYNEAVTTFKATSAAAAGKVES